LRCPTKEGRINRGLALVIGQHDTTIAEALAAASQLQVILLLDDAEKVTSARHDLLHQSIVDHGQVSVQQDVQQEPLPFADYAFNVVVSTGELANQRAAELHRILQPGGGILYVEDATTDAASRIEAAFDASGAPAIETRRVGNSTIYRRGKLPGALDWDSETTRDQRVKWPLEHQRRAAPFCSILDR
jgi:SAM-dependent methyltransferase